MNIGQLRRNQINSYSTALSYRQDLIKNENSIIDFYDQCMYLSGANVVSSIYSYYLKFEVTQLPETIQEFSIKLQSDEIAIDDIQNIRSFIVKQGMDKTTFELIFTPNLNYNQIIFELKRSALDFNINNSNGTNGRIMDIKILQFDRVINVISSYLAKNYIGMTSLKKIGIQGPPGLLFCIDGEEIRIGRSGIYELYNEDISISYIGFIIKDSLFTQDGKDFFIMDFKY